MSDPFRDLDAYIALPRTSGLAIAPDGSRLVTTVQTIDRKAVKYVTSLWEVDPTGAAPARRLTRSAKGEGGPAFLPDGSLLFCSSRSDPDADPDAKDGDDETTLWLLPAGGGEAHVVAHRPGGLGGVAAAASGTVAVLASTFASSADADAEARTRRARKDKQITAILHESYPVRFWDHDLGPAWPRLFAGVLTDEPEPSLTLTDLTPDAGAALDEAEYDISPDGTTIATAWWLGERGGKRAGLALIEVATGERRIVADDPESEYGNPRFSPDGTQVAFVRERRSTPYEPDDRTLAVLDLATGATRDIAPSWDRWPAGGLRWTPDGSALICVADDDGRAPVFRVSVGDGTVTRLTGDAFAYSDVVVSPDGEFVYALRSAVHEPPRPVRLRATGADQASTPLRGPADPPPVPGRVDEIEVTASDGTRVRGWLVLPEGADPDTPAPLLLWIHGGPLGSWNAWSWRWCPWLLAAHGYAVLLPDPALSTGYGREFIRRGWGAWGAAPYTDLMAITDAAVARDDIDAERTAAMGGSFGGYMANWVAGHTDRFRAIVTHASLWALEQFGPTTDAAWYWQREMTAEMMAANTPHQHVAKIVTPMLVIHGDRDYRVPIGEALRLWAELAVHAGADDGSMPHKFLYFPDENHWVLTPQHAKIWYQTVQAFLAHHVLGEPWQAPELLT